jgi:haloalkane dehalogenase
LRHSARAVRAVLETLDIKRVVLVVHDTGGPPAFAAAADLPASVVGIVGMNTFGWRPAGAALRGMLTVMGSAAMRQFSLRTGALARLTSSSFGVGRHLNAIDGRVYRHGLQKGMSVFHDYLRDALDSDVYADAARAFAGPLRHVPLLTVFGERNDPFGFQQQWRTLYPLSRRVVIRGGNHFPMCDAPDLVTIEICDWFRTHVATAPGSRT